MKAYGILNPKTDFTPPTVPGSLSAVALSTTEISLTWLASTDAVGVSGYQIWRGGVARATTSSLTYTDSGLTPSTAYSYRVSAYDAAGNMSELSNIATASTHTPAVNQPPVWPNIPQQDLIVGTGYTYTLTPTDPEGQPVAVTQVAGTLPTGLNFNSSTRIINGTPTAGGSTSVSFRASDGVTSSDRVIVFSVLAADTTAPSVPTNLTATAVSPTGIDVTWSASTDTAGANEVSSGMSVYRLFRDGLFRANINHPTLLYQDRGLAANTTYSYQLRAVDVAGNLSALTTAVQATTQVNPAPNRLYIPGHYTTLLRGVRNNQSRNSMAARIVRDSSGNLITKAFKKRYTWRQLEPTQGSYSFITNPSTDELTLDVAWAQTNGVKLIPLIEDKTFLNNEKPGPEYMLPYMLNAPNGDYFMARWDPFYVTRFNALLTAIGNTFDGIASFGGVATQETAMGSPTDAQLGIGSAVPTGKLYLPYTTTRYRDAAISVIQHAATALPTRRFYWGANFIRGDVPGDTIVEILNATKALGHLVLWGPDILPNNTALKDRFYPWVRQFAADMPICMHAQPDSYSSPNGTGFHTMAQIRDFAIDTTTNGTLPLQANMICWTYIANPTQSGGNDYDDAIPVMQARPTFNVESW